MATTNEYRRIMDKRNNVLNEMVKAEDRGDWQEADRLRQESFLLLTEAQQAQSGEFTADDAYGRLAG